MTPDAIQQQIVRTFFDETSSVWSKRYRDSPRKMSDLDLLLRRENAHRLLWPILEAATRRLRVLDLGCGTGDGLDRVPREKVSVVGLDVSPAMVSAASRLHPEDHFVVADAGRFPIAPKSFDVLHCLGVLEYVLEYKRLLRWMYRTLRPGGYLIVSFPNRASLLRKLSRVEIGIEHGLIRAAKLVARRPRQLGGGPTYRHRAWTVNSARTLLGRSGFEVEETLWNTFGLMGRIGRLSLSQRASRWMTQKLRHRRMVSSWLAHTVVIRARKAV